MRRFYCLMLCLVLLGAVAGFGAGYRLRLRPYQGPVLRT